MSPRQPLWQRDKKHYITDITAFAKKLFLDILNTYLRHRTAPIFTSGQLATSGAIWTCWGSTGTCNISYNRLRCCLLQPRDGCILFVTCTRRDVTCVSVGAAVDTIRAAYSLHKQGQLGNNRSSQVKELTRINLLPYQIKIVTTDKLNH